MLPYMLLKFKVHKYSLCDMHILDMVGCQKLLDTWLFHNMKKVDHHRSHLGRHHTETNKQNETHMSEWTSLSYNK